ncbi:MAG: hypothetical protein JWM98_1275 [Thermoleophilia bacterium]|nr:hypothetical protein [Thermoleophilia bacterium]
MTGRRAHRGEAGVALIWAILVMIVVFGTIAVAVGMTLTRVDETRSGANKTRAGFWTQAASDDLAQRLQSREIGYLVSGAGVGDQTWTVPTTGNVTPPGRTFSNGGSTAARRMSVTDGSGVVHTGWYQVLPAATGGTPWQARYVRDPARPDAQGSVEVIVRAWEEGLRAEPVTARLTFRHASFSRFSLLSDDKMRLGGVGNVTPRGYVHTNNARNAANAITIEAGADFSNTRRVTTSSGAINGIGLCGGKCVANVSDIVEFGAASRSMDRVRQLAASSTPIAYAAQGVARTWSTMGGPLAANVAPDQIPVWIVDLASCGDGVGVGQARWPVRQDLVGVPEIDDKVAPTPVGGISCYPVATGGGAILLNGDVIVRGNRTSTHSVTVYAKREGAPIDVPMDVDGDPTTPFTPARVTAPASVYLLQSGGPVGSTSPLAPVGIVAEGGVYLPSYAMAGPNRVMSVQNVAAMAMGSEVSYGPSIISIAADSSEVGLGLSPAEATLAGYGSGQSLTWNGAIASRRQVTFRYGKPGGGNWLGYATRNLTYPMQMIWNPPPSFPTDRDWHLADYREFNAG